MSDDRDSSDGASLEERLASSGDRHEIKTVITGATIALGGDFLAMARDPAAGSQLAWSSSDPAIATVTQEGLVQTHGPGNVVITAMSARHSRTISLRVGAAEIIPEVSASDHVTDRSVPRWASISGTATIAVVGLAFLGWSLATGSSSGEDSGGTLPPALDPPPISIASVALLGPGGPIDGPIELTVGDSTSLRAEVSTETGERVADADVTMQSSDPAVASILGGVLVGRTAGEALITARVAGVDFSSVRVLILTPPPPPPPPTIASLQLGGVPLVLYEGDSVSVPPVDARDGDGASLLDTSPAFAVADPRIGRVVANGWLVGLEPGSSWLTAQVGRFRDSVSVQVTPVPVEITAASRLELPVDSALITAVTLLDRSGDTIPEADLIWFSLAPDLVEVDEATGRMVGRNSGVGRIVVSLQDFNLSDTILVLVISGTLQPPPLPNLPDQNAVTALVEQCFEGMADWTEADLRARLGGGDAEVLSSILDQLNSDLRFEEIEAQEPAVRRSELEAYSDVRVRLSWDSGFGPRLSRAFQVVADATWDGAAWQSNTCSVGPV